MTIQDSEHVGAPVERRTSSVLDRGRPSLNRQRPSSFFGIDGDQPEEEVIVDTSDALGHSTTSSSGSGPGNSTSTASRNVGEVPWHRASNTSVTAGPTMYGIRSPSPGVESSYGEFGVVAQDELDDPNDFPSTIGASGPGHSSNHARRSSFYGLDDHTAATAAGFVGAVEDSPQTPSSSTHYVNTSSRHLHDSGSGSGSGSFSSHEAAAAAAAAGRRQMSQQASRRNSLYALGGQGTDARLLLDQSHLQPGQLASLLSHEKTLDLYRANARKTSDPDVQFEFCTFVMEIVAEMDAVAAAATAAQQQNVPKQRGQPNSAAALRSTADEVQEIESKHKRQALVAESVALLNKLANRGHVKSQYFLADCYTQGIGTPKGKRDYDKAFNLFLLAGKHGHSDACYRAAQCCENGWGCKRDSGKAVSLYRRAAVLNHPEAMHRLALAELNGELGCSRRPREGVRWLKRAAELADQVDPPQPKSLHELAMLHEKGIENVIFQDEEYAAELLARAAELQYAPSAYKLGECYEYGKMGCPQDSALSIHYYNIAAQQSHREACFALTAWYLVGSPGVLPQSDTEAYLWARKAADLELAKAEYAVGYFTESGIGTYRDQREALEWFSRAASHGDKRAMDRLRIAGVAGAGSKTAVPTRSQRQPAPGTPYKPPPVTKIVKKDAQGPPAESERKRGKSVDRGRSKDVLPPIPTSHDAGYLASRPQISSDGSSHGAYHDARRPDFPRRRSASTPVNNLAGSPEYSTGGPAPPPRLPALPTHETGHLASSFMTPPGAAPPMHGHHASYHSSSLPPRTHSHQYSQQHQSPAATMSSLPPGAGRGAQPVQVKMPVRQGGPETHDRRHAGDDSSLAAAAGAGGPHHHQREKALLQRRSGPGEDKDCVVM